MGTDALRKQIKRSRTLSALSWQGAMDGALNPTEAADWQSQANNCDDHYASALDALDDNDAEAVQEALEYARQAEADGGDDQHARAALDMLALCERTEEGE